MEPQASLVTLNLECSLHSFTTLSSGLHVQSICALFRHASKHLIQTYATMSGSRDTALDALSVLNDTMEGLVR